MPGGRRVRPRGRPYTFACRVCRIVLRDGVDYTWCPRCNHEVDWIDGRYRVLTCGPCDLLVNKRVVEHDACPNCEAPLTLLSGPLGADVDPPHVSPLRTAGRHVALVLVILLAVFALLDPEAFPYLGPLLVAAQLVALLAVLRTVSLSQELRALAGYRTTRVIHGLEHATATVLGERGLDVRSGETSHGMFTLEVDPRGIRDRYETFETTVRDAASDAISRIRFGETALAYRADCRASETAAGCLLALAIVGAGMVAVILGAAIAPTFAGTVAAGLLARASTRRAGLAVQRWLTVSTALSSAVVTHVEKRRSSDGDTLIAIVMIDVIPRTRSSDVDAVAPVPL